MRPVAGTVARAALIAASAALIASCSQMLGIEDLDLQSADGSAGSAGTGHDAEAGVDAPPDVSVDSDGGQQDGLHTDSDAKDVTAEQEADTGAPDVPGDVADEVTCLFGTKACAGQCVSTNQVATGCAQPSCDPCVYAHASAICESSGNCALAQCVNGFENCDNVASNGCEAALKTDVDNCGTCGKKCAFAHATPSCIGGTCALDKCAAGWADCDNDPVNGCEIEIAADPNNCGTCGVGCAFPHATSACASGTCQLAACQADYLNCDAQAANGCEVYSKTDPDHCGSCPTSCNPDGGTQKSCKNGVCVTDTCAPGTGDCDGNTSNGCETNTNTSPTSCGSCGFACQFAHATPICTSGDCHLASCDAGYANCDGNEANGCESNTLTSTSNCGGCGALCTAKPHATAACVAGSCELNCDTGFADCDSNAANGCEAGVLGDVLHCGSCTTACSSAHGTPGCATGVCTITCDSGWGDCDTGAAGCETNLNTSKDHCGTCSTVCSAPNATSECSSGSCAISACSAGWSNCDSQFADGCEAQTAANVTNCGACGRACSTQGVASVDCASSVCDSFCVAGWANCSMPASGPDDGCELSVASNNTSCGGCGNDCTKQGAGLVCGSSGATSVCSCPSASACNPHSSAGTCLGNGLCKCAGANCRRGEHCEHDSGQNVDYCSCNGAAACAAGQTCCQTPSGCKDLTTDPQNCAACGHSCPPGFQCKTGACQCNGDGSCNAGSSGTCTAGACVCSSQTCAAGARCMVGGGCG
ncbi:MAG: hypothetical protein HY898_21475 [Deltaproteobacteria bacterium]|nr:hypothetical protein [Deltaproteobacteria bacterium]